MVRLRYLAGRSAARMILAAAGLLLCAQTTAPPPSWLTDEGDGTYRNPVLAGDYSDPDVLRVGADYYLTASSFSNVPGLPILHSRDLVNWRLIGHALPQLFPDGHYSTPRRGGGVWAPAWAYRHGQFRIYFPDPDFGVYMVSAKDPKGPWSKPVLVDATPGAIDPAPFWDDDGSAWLVHAYAKSRAGISNIIILKRMNKEGTRTLDAGRRIIVGDALPQVRTSIGIRPWQTTEGPKLYKRDGWYWIFVPSGSVKGGWQGVFRARRLAGPWEGRDVLDQGTTPINGPHQGAWIRTQTGEDWFFHFQDSDSYGRRVWLEPMRWRDGWPVIGEDADGDGIGQPVLRFKKPSLPPSPAATPETDDDFTSGQPSLAWQWNSNPQDNWIGRGMSGWLRLPSASTPANLWDAGNVLSRKLPAERFVATVKLRFAPLRDGERAGLAVIGYDYSWIGVERVEGKIHITQVVRRAANMQDSKEAVVSGPLVGAERDIWLRLRAAPVTVADPVPDFAPYWPSMLRSTHARIVFEYSLDGQNFTSLGQPFVTRPGRWVGAQIGLFAQAPSNTPAFSATTVGYADFDWFHFTP